MKALTKDDLLLIIQNSPRTVWYEDEIVNLFNKYGDDHFIEGPGFKRFGSNERMVELRKTLIEMEKYLP